MFVMVGNRGGVGSNSHEGSALTYSTVALWASRVQMLEDLFRSHHLLAFPLWLLSSLHCPVTIEAKIMADTLVHQF